MLHEKDEQRNERKNLKNQRISKILPGGTHLKKQKCKYKKLTTYTEQVY